MAREQLVVGIDVGTTKICTLIARVSDDDQPEVIGTGVMRTDALRKGIVVSVDDAARDIQSSVQKAEHQSGFKIISAYVSISGSHIQSQEVHGTITVRRPDRPIGDEEIARVLDAARITALPADRELIDLVPRGFSVDDQDDIASPHGMHGTRLAVQGTLITGAKSAIQNLTHCVERAGISIDALVFQGLASGQAVLTPAERDLGVTLVDLGGGTTDVAVFAEGNPIYAASLPVGGQQVTNDIAVRVRTPFSAAEEIKLRHGQAYSDEREEDRFIDVSAFDKAEGSSVSVRILSETIEDRLVDTFELVRMRLAQGGFGSSLPAGTVLVGGTAQLRGVRRLAAEVLESPVRIGLPSGIVGLGDQLTSPAFAASVGLLRWGLRQSEEAPVGAPASTLGGLWNAITDWFRGFMP